MCLISNEHRNFLKKQMVAKSLTISKGILSRTRKHV